MQSDALSFQLAPDAINCRWLELATSAARSAGSFIVEQRSGSMVVELSRYDIKLDLDKKAELVIADILGVTDLPILCEETGWVGSPGSTYWLVDGIDGTVNLHYGLPFVAVSIALMQDNAPVLGVVYDFRRDEMFAGALGLGATLNGICIKPSSVATTIDQALLLTALATHGSYDQQVLSRFGCRLGRWKKVRMLGSAALSLAYVASARADACEIHGIMAWDVMAGIALLRAAGGDAHWEDLGDQVGNIYASNGCLNVKGEWDD